MSWICQLLEVPPCVVKGLIVGDESFLLTLSCVHTFKGAFSRINASKTTLLLDCESVVLGRAQVWTVHGQPLAGL